MSAVDLSHPIGGGGRPFGEIKRRAPVTTPLIGESAPARKSATHGEAGYARNARDAYFTEPWVTKALLDAVEFGSPIWEPACGDGRMAEAILNHPRGYCCAFSDVHDYGYEPKWFKLCDFVRDPCPWPETQFNDVITNPPFDLAREFVRKALHVVYPQRGKVAILQRHEFDAPKANWPLFEPPFAQKLILSKRPRWSTADKASPRFPYAWYVWDWRHEGAPIIRWLDDGKIVSERLL